MNVSFPNSSNMLGTDLKPADGDYIWNAGAAFDTGVGDLSNQMKQAMSMLSTSPSDPVYLAQYQEVVSEFSIYRNAQTSTVHALSDVDKTILGNYR
ncbi:type III secretion system needle filament subunit SctF [Burkholderia sp. BCC1630]|nr:type III secretion system needle filament subunit SctF [Burkholderia sp. BCC1630]